MNYDIQAIRAQFPALHESFNGRPAVFFDNPGGTQVPQMVIDAVTDYYTRRNANVHGAFITSQRTDETVDNARQAMADLLGADTDEIVFGNNMTSLAFQLSHSLAAELQAGDEIVITRLDHEGNVSPWLMLAQDTGAQIRWVDFDMETCTLDMAHMASLINSKTKLVAVGYASNATGTINNVKQAVQLAHSQGAYAFVDAVQYAPHGLIDVKDLDCDFLACSAYKFFGPHVGVLYGKREHMNRMRSYQVRTAEKQSPDKWETGTKNHEGLAGVAAAVDYIASVGVNYGMVAAGASRREKLRAAWSVIQRYEKLLVDKLLTGLDLLPNVRVYGITSRFDFEQRVATVAIRKEGTTPQQLAQALAAENVFVTEGNFYALSVTERLGVELSGGLLRIGLAHYNTVEEIEQCLRVLAEV